MQVHYKLCCECPTSRAGHSWMRLKSKDQETVPTLNLMPCNYHGGSHLTILYETVYSDSQVKPSMFKRNDVTQPTSSGMVEQGRT